MKKQILSMILLISLFKPTSTMEMEIEDWVASADDQALEQAYSGHDIKSIQKAIFDIFHEKNKNICERYEKIGKIITKLDFSNPHNIPFRNDLIEYIKNLEAIIYPLKNSINKDEPDQKLQNKLDQKLASIIEHVILLETHDRMNKEAYKGTSIQISELIIRGANLNFMIKYDECNASIFSQIVRFDIYSNLMPLFLIYGANINLPDPDGNLPITHAGSHENKKSVKQLISFGADINTQDALNAPVIFQLLKVLNKKTLDMFLRYGCELNAVSKQIALIALISPKSLKLLIDYGLDINTVDKKGMTVLLHAAQSKPDIIPFLLEHGAKDIPSNSEMTAYKFAKRYRPEILPLLEKYNPQNSAPENQTVMPREKESETRH